MLYDKQKVQKVCAEILSEIKADKFEIYNAWLNEARTELEQLKNSWRRYFPKNWKYKQYFDCSDHDVVMYMYERWPAHLGFWSARPGSRQNRIEMILRLCNFDSSQDQVELTIQDIFEARIKLDD